MRDKNHNPDTATWINPTGGLGDILILSGVLKQWVDKNPGLKFNLVRRAIYTDLLKGHPAIGEMGFPPKDAKMITNDYWRKEKLGGGLQRPFQVIARSLGLQTPVEEILYLPDEPPQDTSLIDLIPGARKKIVIIAPSSSSPRKMMTPMFWHVLVEALNKKGVFVIQVGQKEDVYIKGTYSMLGLTSPRQLVSVLKIAEVIVSVDNFIMHAAHLIRKPSIIIWGPTQS